MASSQSSEDDSKRRAGLFTHGVNEWDLKPGDHIYVYRAAGLYSHHGIYTGEDEHEVIHFSTMPDDNGIQICGCTLEKFLTDPFTGRKSQLRLTPYDEDLISKLVKRSGTAHCIKSRPAADVIATAKYYLEHPWHEYGLFFNNCESFAFYCKTGTEMPAGVSSQVYTIAKVIVPGVNYTEDIIDVIMSIGQSL